jgi:hypothetical protein
MKKVRTYLSLFAVLFAIGGAFASRLIVSEPGYRFDANATVKCIYVEDCANTGGADCVVSSNQLWKKETNNTCQTHALTRAAQ